MTNHAEQADGQPLRALIIDDDLASDLAEILEHIGGFARPDLAVETETAQRRLRANKYDLVILDGYLRGPKPPAKDQLPNGVALLTCLRRGDLGLSNKDTPILFCSASPAMCFLAMALPGRLVYLEKPFRRDEMKKALEKLLQQWETDL